MVVVAQQQFAKDINFQKVVFLHINRILGTNDNASFIRLVKLMELLFSPYIDDDYLKGVDSSTNSLSNVSRLDSASKERVVMIEAAQLELSETKFSELMVLAERNDLLLGKEAEGVDPQYVEESEDTY